MENNSRRVTTGAKQRVCVFFSFARLCRAFAPQIPRLPFFIIGFIWILNPKSIHSQCHCMDITDEQRKRAEANRLAAIAKRKALIESSDGQPQHQDPWKLFKCRKLSTELNATNAVQSSKSLTDSNTHLPERFRARLEICSPDSFSITPEVVEGCFYPGEENCFRKLSGWLSNVCDSGILSSLSLFCASRR